MTRCAKFHHLFDEVGDFCGMSPTAISQYKAYREQVSKLTKLGIDEDFIFENFPEGPGRVLSNIKDDDTRTKALNYVAACLKRKEKVTESDLRSTLKAWQESTGKSCTVGKKGGNLGHVSKNFTNVKPPTEEKPDCSPTVLKDRLPEEPAPTTNEKLISANLVIAPVQSPFKTASQVKAGIAGEMFPDPVVKETLTAPTWTPAACPACEHVIIQKVLGNKCKQTGGLCQDVKECPVERRKQMAQEQGFVIAGSGAPSLQGKPITTEHPPLKVIPVQLTKEQAEAAITSVVRGYFTPKSQEQWTQLKKVGGWDTDLEALEGLRDDAAGRME